MEVSPPEISSTSGKDFLFDYDSFLIHLPKVESMKMPDKSATDGSQESQGLNNQKIESGGVLYINKPNNKSALKDFPQYPIYTASSGADFYFDNPEILDGAYDRTVYFTAPPFTLDSVSNSDQGTVSFEGTFHSGGLFPDFNERITIMPDNSLGFIHNIPEGGYPLYGDRGTLYNMITMDNRGLRSAGTITSNTTTLESTDFTFYLDSVTTRGTLAKIEEASDENYEFPEVSVTGYEMTWVPDKDLMFLANVDDPFVLFHETASLDGSLTVSSQGASGSGSLITRGSKTISNQLTLRSDEVAAKGAQFEIESSDADKPHFVGDDVSLEFQLTNEIATLQIEEEGILSIELPYTQIKTSIPKVEWNLAEGKVYLDNSLDFDPEKSFVQTTRPSLDSLTFQASGAVYDLQDHSLDISGIPFISVADARIKPKDQKLKIFEGATIPRLVEAELIIDTLNRFHQLYDGDIEIISRKAFQGSATYSYTNTQDQTFGIRMKDFELLDKPDSEEGRKYSVSSGLVNEMDGLFISPGVIFKGSATMHAIRKTLVWEGLVKLDLQSSGGDTWIRYSNDADLVDVVLPFGQSLTENGEALTSGLFFDQQGLLYGSFLSVKRSSSDQAFFTPGGQLFYDQTVNLYKIEDYQRTSGESYANNSFIFDDENSQLDFEGSFDILPNVYGFGLEASGMGTGNLNKGDYTLNTLLTIDFEIPAQLLTALVRKVVQQFEGRAKNRIEAIDNRKIAQIAGDEAASAYQKRSINGSAPLYSISPTLNRSFVFSKVDLAWSTPA